MFNYDEKVIPAFEDKTFNDLFEVLPKGESFRLAWLSEAWEHTSNGHTFKHPNGENKSAITGHFYFSATKGVQYRESIEVKPSSAVIEWIKEHMLIIDRDSIYFEGILFADGTMTVYAKYNQIIGSRLLGFFNISELGQ